MAELAGVFAASHAPLIGRDWHLFSPELQARLAAPYEELGRRIDAVRPDIIVEIAPDHWVNFFLNNLPSVCIGVGARHAGPPEPFLRDFPRELAGDAEFAAFFAEAAFAADFEPALSHQLTLDHGFCIPLDKLKLARLPRIVPLVVNDLEPPMLSVRRCLAWGRLLAETIRAYPKDVRIAVLASGGLSHSIGEATMGAIDEPFDRMCIGAFGGADDVRLATEIAAGLARTGNGAHEVRNWVIAHAAAGGRGFDLIAYLPVPEVYVGCAFASWAA